MWIDLNGNRLNSIKSDVIITNKYKKPKIWKLSLTTYILSAIFSEKLS